MFKIYLKKGLLYTLGIILISIAVAINAQHLFGHYSFDQVISITSKLLNLELGTMITIFNLVLIATCFIVKKNKDILISILAVITLGWLINLINRSFFTNINVYEAGIIARIFAAFFAINIGAIGVAIIIKTKISALPFDQAIVLLTEIESLKKLDFGKITIIIEIIFMIIAILLTLIFFAPLNISNYYFTLVAALTNGAIINIYLRIYDTLFLKEVKN